MPVSRFSDNCRCKGDSVWLGWREAQADELASPGEVLLMPIQSECPAPAAVNGTPQEPLPLPRTRLRHLGRITLVLASCLAPAATALAIGWLTSPKGLRADSGAGVQAEAL